MFNVYFPKLLEMRWGAQEEQTLETSLWEIVLFTLGGCPGPFVCFFSFLAMYSDELTFGFEQVGAYVVSSRLGRKWSLAGSTFMTALSCIVFADVSSNWAVMLSSIGFSFCSTVFFSCL